MKDFAGSHAGNEGLGQAMEEALAKQRSRVREAFAEFSCAGGRYDKVLDLGAIGRSQAADRLHAKGRSEVDHRITFHDVLLPSDRQRSMEGKESVSVLELPFADEEFDWVFCNRILECAGDTVQQFMLLRELARVARCGIFVTASNRKHPLEFNTGLPLLHWLPEGLWKKSLAMLGKRPTTAGLPLNLLDASDLSKMAGLLADDEKFKIGHIRHLGIKAMFFLMLRK